MVTCGVVNADYYMDKNDSSSYYVCEGALPVCNVANGSYYIEKAYSGTWSVCEGAMPVCNSANQEYIFKQVETSTFIEPTKKTTDTEFPEKKPAVSRVPALQKEEAVSAEPTTSPKTFSFGEFGTSTATSTPDSERQNTAVERAANQNILQKFFSWIKSLFKL